MSVVCHEDGCGLLIADEAFCATTLYAEEYVALCAAHVASLTVEHRLPEPIDGGIDIHFLFGKPNGIFDDPELDTLSLSKGLEMGDYRFSIGPDVGALVLPKTMLFLQSP